MLQEIGVVYCKKNGTMFFFLLLFFKRGICNECNLLAWLGSCMCPDLC